MVCICGQRTNTAHRKDNNFQCPICNFQPVIESGEANSRDVHYRVAIVVVTVMARRNPAKIFIESSDSSESEPTLTSGDSDDLTSKSESEEENPGSSKVTAEKKVSQHSCLWGSVWVRQPVH